MNIFILFIGPYHCGEVGKGDIADGHRFGDHPQCKTLRCWQGYDWRRWKNSIRRFKTAANSRILSADGRRTARLPFDAQTKILVHVDFHEKAFDIDHCPWNIQFLNDLFQDLVILLPGHDNQTVGGFIGG